MVEVRRSVDRPARWRRVGSATVLRHHVAGVVHHVGVVARTADHRHRGKATIGKRVIKRTAIQRLADAVAVAVTGSSRLAAVKSDVLSVRLPVSSMPKFAILSPLVSPSRIVTLWAAS